MRLLAALLLAFVAAGCGGAPIAWRPPPGPDGYVHTLTNLHPDERRAQLSSNNYQQPALIPVCTAIVIEQLTTRAMVFVVAQTGRRYTYRFETRHLGEPHENHLARYVGPDCDRATLQGL